VAPGEVNKKPAFSHRLAGRASRLHLTSGTSGVCAIAHGARRRKLAAILVADLVG